MRFVKSTLGRLPRLDRLLKSPFLIFERTPPISFSAINKSLIRECVAKRAPTILEIGCYDGSHTLWFAEIFDNPKIYCFEPDPRAIARFGKKVGHRSNIELFEVAVADRDGEATFFQSGGQQAGRPPDSMPEGWDCSGSIRKPKNHLKVHPWVTFDKTIKVKTVTLDSWCEEHRVEAIDFIWMDVQGAEIDVISGAAKALRRTRYLYTEYDNRELYKGQAGLRKILRQLTDFKVLIRYPGDVLLRNERFEPGQ